MIPTSAYTRRRSCKQFLLRNATIHGHGHNHTFIYTQTLNIVDCHLLRRFFLFAFTFIMNIIFFFSFNYFNIVVIISFCFINSFSSVVITSSLSSFQSTSLPLLLRFIIPVFLFQVLGTVGSAFLMSPAYVKTVVLGRQECEVAYFTVSANQDYFFGLQSSRGGVTLMQSLAFPFFSVFPRREYGLLHLPVAQFRRSPSPPKLPSMKETLRRKG